MHTHVDIQKTQMHKPTWPPAEVEVHSSCSQLAASHAMAAGIQRSPSGRAAIADCSFPAAAKSLRYTCTACSCALCSPGRCCTAGVARKCRQMP